MRHLFLAAAVERKQEFIRMRILYLDSPVLLESFRAQGHDVVSAGFDPVCDIVVSCPRNARSLYDEASRRMGSAPDWVFWCDSSNLPYITGIENLPCPTAFYSIDTYCQLWHFGFANAFDVVFVAQKDHVPLFPTDSVRVQWLPLFARKTAKALPGDGERDIPVSFVGTRSHPNNPDREPFLRGFKHRQPLLVYSGEYEDIFARSKIVLNQTACNEVNFRCFEAMACGAALLMEYCEHGLRELFTPGENILPLYPRNNHAAAAAIAADALRHPEALEALAQRGKELVLHNHMAGHRAAEISAVMENLVTEKVWLKRASELGRRREFIAASYAMLGFDLTGQLDDVYADYFFNTASAIRERAAARP